jgi:hypothetical protein
MNPHEISDAEIDALVCGELDGQEYRQAILRIEAQPHRWRDCGLAFLREQALAQTLKQIAAGDIQWLSEPSKALSPETRLEQPKNSDEVIAKSASGPVDRSKQVVAIQGQGSQFGLGRTSGRTAANWRLLAGLAATLLVGFIVGRLVDGQDSIPRNQSSQVAHVGQNGSAEVPPVQADASSIAANSDTNRNSQWNVRNKSEGYGNLSSQLLPIDLTIPESLRELERRGKIRIETANAVMPLNRQDGTSILVPVQQLQIVPVVYSY